MKRIFLTLLMLISLISTMEAKSILTLNAGKNQSIKIGNSIVLNGKVVKGNKSKIEYYQWTEKGKVLNNALGDEILYTNIADAENDYKPTLGEHLLHFEAIGFDGKKYDDTLLVVVTKDGNGFIIDAGEDKTLTLGEIIVLNGVIQIGTKKNNISKWLENGKVLKNALGDEILYTNYADRENDYRPTTGATLKKHNSIQLTYSKIVSNDH